MNDLANKQQDLKQKEKRRGWDNIIDLEGASHGSTKLQQQQAAAT